MRISLPRKAFGTALAILAIAVPCIPLLPLGDLYYSDWYNHVWHLSYYAQFLKTHGSLPVTLNTSSDLGMAQPIFYGYLFYSSLAPLALVLGANLSLKLAAVGLFALQYFCVVTTIKRLGGGWALARITACLVLWALYPMTNLYNRNALTEFFAVGFLTCAVLNWFQLLASESKSERFWLGLRLGFFFCLAAGIHPITGLCGSVFLALLVVLTGPLCGMRKVLPALIAPALATVIVLLPWLYATASFGSKLLISKAKGWVLYPGIDTILARFIPYDSRMVGHAVKDVSTPYLDATTNLPLVLLLSVVAWRIGRAVGRSQRNQFVVPIDFVAFEFFLFFLFASLDIEIARLLPAVFEMVQFGYRLVTYQDLSILAGLLTLLFWYRREVKPPTLAVAACVALALGNVTVKWTHVNPIRNYHGPLSTQKSLTSEPNRLPEMFNGYPDYTIDMCEKLSEKPETFVSFPLRATSHFGEWDSVAVKLKSARWIGTNLQPSPWARIYINGHEASLSDCRIYLQQHQELAIGLLGRGHPLVAVRVPAGTHVIDARIVPNRLWLSLRSLAFLLLLAWAAVLVLHKKPATFDTRV